MSVKTMFFAGALSVFALAGTQGRAQDGGPAAQDPAPTPPQGHTLDQLRRDIDADAKKVGRKLREVGRDIKDDARQVGSGVASEFEAVKADVLKYPLHHRVYARIHWDKSLHGAKIEVHMPRNGVVRLRGTVPTEAARRHAAELASDSVGVTTVINELTVASKVASASSAVSPKPSTRR